MIKSISIFSCVPIDPQFLMALKNINTKVRRICLHFSIMILDLTVPFHIFD